jgi:uncharacterized repeat protein (TIGR04052 family)
MRTPHAPNHCSRLLGAAALLLLACGSDDDNSTPAETDSGAQTTDKDSGTADKDSGTTDKDAGTEQPDAAVEEAKPSAFSLRFALTAAGKPVGCADTLTGLGKDKNASVDINDVRFFVSDLSFLDGEGEEVEHTLDENDFQIQHEKGTVSLVDLTSNTEGGCTPDVFPDSEGTKRVHEAITGTTLVDKVAAVRFTVGVPQPLMGFMAQNYTEEDAPSPLAECMWPWAVGYRHFVFNFTLKNGAGEAGIGYLHIGSLDCAPDFESKALSDRERCGLVNNPAVALTDFSLTDDVVTVDLAELMGGLDFIAPTYNEDFTEITGEGPGVACHSMPDDEATGDNDCTPTFDAFGLTPATGEADASKNRVFVAAEG